MRGTASGSSTGTPAGTSQRESIPAAAKPALKRLAASPPSPSPPSSSSRVWPLLEAVLLEEAAPILFGSGAAGAARWAGGRQDVPAVSTLERGVDGVDALACARLSCH